ncbi:MAG TPA: hypothetical protein VGF71_03140 [Caulobacteraceae bacterium]|jgi:hypothetical protein
MRTLASLMVTTALLAASGAWAGQQIVPVIDSASAVYSIAPHTIVIRVTAELPNTCWSNPQLRPMTAQARPGGGIVGFAVVANLKTGVMCAMHVSKVTLPGYNWKTYPNGVRGIQVAGSKQPVTAMIARTGG